MNHARDLLPLLLWRATYDPATCGYSRDAPLTGAPNRSGALRSEFVGLARAMLQRAPFNPTAAASRGPVMRDTRYALACQQQRSHLLAQRAAAVQFALPVNGSCVSVWRKCHQHHQGESFLHVLFDAIIRQRLSWLLGVIPGPGEPGLERSGTGIGY